MIDPLTPATLNLTESVGNAGEISLERNMLRKARRPTEDDVVGPFYRAGAPFRGKICPPMANGEVLVISGRVWSFRRQRPIDCCVLGAWAAEVCRSSAGGRMRPRGDRIRAVEGL